MMRSSSTSADGSNFLCMTVDMSPPVQLIRVNVRSGHRFPHLQLAVHEGVRGTMDRRDVGPVCGVIRSLYCILRFLLKSLTRILCWRRGVICQGFSIKISVSLAPLNVSLMLPCFYWY